MTGGPPRQETSWPRRLAWFVGLWLAGVGTVALAAYLVRLLIS